MSAQRREPAIHVWRSRQCQPPWCWDCSLCGRLAREYSRLEWAADDARYHLREDCPALEQARAASASIRTLDANLPVSQPEPEQLPATYSERAAQGWEYAHIADGHWGWRKVANA